MAVSGNTSAIMAVGIAALVAWRMYSRIRRLIGRQRLSKVRPWVSVILFPTIVLLLLAATFSRPDALGGLAAGLVLGAVLGEVGLRLTKFERTPEGFFYTPNAHIGIALSLLLVVRVLWRVGQVYAGISPTGTSADFVRSPLTLAIFGTLAGYYVRYAVGLIIWRNRPAPPAGQGGP